MDAPSLHDTLIEAALAAVRAQGIDAVSLRAVARDAGVSHAAYARHFRDKDELLDAAADVAHARLEHLLFDGMRAPGSVLDRLVQQAHHYADFAIDEPHLSELMERRRTGRTGNHWTASIERTTRARRRGELQGDPAELVVAGAAMLRGLVGLYRDGSLTRQELRQAIDGVYRATLVRFAPGDDDHARTEKTAALAAPTV